LKSIETIFDNSSGNFHPVVDLPKNYTVLDLTNNLWNSPETEFSIGRYDEFRPNMYTTTIFEGIRNIHMGIDLGGPVGTPCMSFMDGEITHFGYNSEPGDYGNVIIIKYIISKIIVWALYGHLDSQSISNIHVGQNVKRGEVVGHFGNNQENGGWEPHLHFQLSLIEPVTHDLPGVVSSEDRVQALLDYPDPRLVLGPLY
tara:strand:- start:1412 stop:2011 length:600 start_codon:yes stop_codon:yes gene_type:complete